MASIWKLNGADVYVDTYSKDSKPDIAELNPINNDEASIFHYLYTPTKTISIEGTVIGESYKNTIESGAGSNVTLITDLVPSGFLVLLMGVTFNRQNVSCQIVDLSQPDTAPVYRMSAELRGSEN